MIQKRIGNVVGDVVGDVLYIVAMVVIVFALVCGRAYPRELGDFDGNGRVEGQDLNLIIGELGKPTMNPYADIDGDGKLVGDFGFAARALTERIQYGERGLLYTAPPAGTFKDGNGVAQVSAAVARSVGTREVRNIWLRLASVTAPANASFVGVEYRLVSGGQVPDPANPTQLLPRGSWSRYVLNASMKGFSRTYAFFDGTADSAAIEWRAIFDDGTTGTQVYPRSSAGAEIRQTVIQIRPIVPNFFARNIRLSPANPQAGQLVTPSVEVGGTTATDQTLSVVTTLNGNVINGSIQVVAVAGSTATTITLPQFTVVAGAMLYGVTVNSGVTESMLGDNAVELNFTVTTPPPPPAPTVTASALTFSPSQPAPGQTVVPSFSLQISTTIARTFVATGTVDGNNPLTIDGSVPVGSTNQTVTMPSFVAQPGTHTYRVSVGVSGVTTTLTATFTVPLVDFSLTSVSMVSTATAGTNVTATINARANNLGAPFVVGLQARRNSVSGSMLASGSVSFTAGQTVTAQAALTVPAMSGTTSVVFVIDPDNKFAEVSEANSFTQAITVTEPPTPVPPDVIAMGVTAPATVSAGASFQATVTALLVRFGQPFTLGFEVRKGATLVKSGIFNIPAIQGGTSEADLTIPGLILNDPGATTLTFVLDPAHAIAEQFEDNNSVTRMVTVVTPPPAPAPDARMVSLALTPTAPTAGQNVIPSVVYGISSTIARNFVITGKLNGATSATFNGTAAAGNTTAAAALTGFTATGGANTYVASIVFSPSTTETNATNNDVTVTFSVPQPPTPTAPTVPTNLSAVPASGSAMINWTAVGNASSYIVKLQAIGSATVTTTAASGAFVSLTGLTNHQTYQVSVRSVNSAGMSTWTSAINLVPGDGGVMTTRYFGSNLSAPAYIDGRSNWSPASAWPMARTTPGQWTLYATTGKVNGEERDFNLVQAGNSSGATWTFVQRDLVSTIRVNGAAGSVATPIRRVNGTNEVLPPTDIMVRTAGSTHFMGTRSSDGSVYTLTQ